MYLWFVLTFQEVKKLEQVRKKAEAISDTADVADRDKWMQIKQQVLEKADF